MTGQPWRDGEWERDDDHSDSRRRAAGDAGRADATIDAVVMDPPYRSGSVAEANPQLFQGHNLRRETSTGWLVQTDNMGTAGLVFLLRSVAFESIRLLRGSGSLLVFCDWRMVPNLAPAIEAAGLRYQNMVIWDKSAWASGLASGRSMRSYCTSAGALSTTTRAFQTC